MNLFDRIFRGRRLRNAIRNFFDDRRDDIDRKLIELAREAKMPEDEIAARLEAGTLIDRLKELLPELREWLDRILKILDLLS